MRHADNMVPHLGGGCYSLLQLLQHSARVDTVRMPPVLVAVKLVQVGFVSGKVCSNWWAALHSAA